MPTVIDELIVTLGLDPSQFKKEAAEAEAALKREKDTALKRGESSLLTITFSEAVTGFGNDDVTLDTANGNLSTLSSADGGKTWTGTFTPTAGTADASNLMSLANSYTDVAGNAGSAGTSLNYEVDTKAPTVAITMSDSALKIGETSVVTFTFSEAVKGFTNADITVQNGTLSPVASSDGGVTWTGTFTPTSGITSAANVITVANASYTDALGNPGSAGASLPIAVDAQAPTLAITSDTPQTPLGAVVADVRHFCGDDWPIAPRLSALEILERAYDDLERKVGRPK